MARYPGEALVPSLAEYILSLSAGSRCFCCGKPLNPDESAGPAGATSGRQQRLTCPHCGSEVADVVGSSSVQTEECATFAGVQRTAA